ncbi:MAG: Gfo/Idh/MocA family protein [Candidatus Izemoplasmataceae bacterium]
MNFGVIGAGRIAKKFSDAVRNNQGNLYAIASRSSKRAKEYQETYGFDKAYDDYEKMLQDNQVDCVYIATPHGLHYEHMMLALKHNKHILCEKAFTLNTKQAIEVFTLAKEKSLFVMEAMWTRFLPITQTLQTLIEDGIIGEVEKLEADFCFKAKKDPDDRLFNLTLGAGALLDVTIYPINYANIFLGIPKDINGKCKLTTTGADLKDEIVYLYTNNKKAILNGSIGHDLPREARIYGSAGKIYVPDFGAATEAYIYDNENTLIKHIQIPHKVNGFEYQIEEVIRCIKEGLIESPIMPHQTTIDILKQMDGLRFSWGIKYPNE